jgi:NitT/TauT family transport system substrate-binding protein
MNRKNQTILNMIVLAGLSITASALAADAPAKPKELAKEKWFHVGSVCEAPSFIAKEKGFWAQEGVDVDVQLAEWGAMFEALSFGHLDAVMELAMNMYKPIEQGLDVKIGFGIHTGGLHILVPIDSPIKKVEDLKGKRIAIPEMGSTPFIFAARILGSKGLDVKKDVEWKVFPEAENELGLKKGEFDAIATYDPISAILIEKKLARVLVNMATDPPYNKEFCCMFVTRSKFIQEHPERATALAKGLIRGSIWVQKNKLAAAKIMVEKKYVNGTVPLIYKCLSEYNFIPSVSGSKDALLTSAREMKSVNLLNAKTNADELAKKSYIDVPGITDEWIAEVYKNTPGEKLTTQQVTQLLKDAGSVSSCCIAEGKFSSCRKFRTIADLTESVEVAQRAIEAGNTPSR